VFFASEGGCLNNRFFVFSIVLKRFLFWTYVLKITQNAEFFCAGKAWMLVAPSASDSASEYICGSS